MGILERMIANSERPSPQEAALRLWSERYRAAKVLFCGGSVVRGEGFPNSDLDVVLIFEKVECAWRESLWFEGWPVEVFGHDVETLTYFTRQDVCGGRPSLAQMIVEALVVPAADAFSDGVQDWARGIIANPPAPPSAEALAAARYAISDLLDDLRADRAPEELRAIVCQLYPLVCNFVLKARGGWSGSGKTLPRMLERAAPDLSGSLDRAFHSFFTTGERGELLAAVSAVLAPFGGELFAGFRADAPATHRAPNPELSALLGSMRRTIA